ncbi:hypothetical protein RDI58_020125 [Solanum bulbocastanum]|uniref:Uncharacterized protein n=1 Tax=Solanum bulbocastanum TaxID=147425 RepID=A0AAN8T9F0_SOLBU
MNKKMQNMGRLAFESFSEASKVDPQNACVLTYCEILYRLVEAAEVIKKFQPERTYLVSISSCFLQATHKIYEITKNGVSGAVPVQYSALQGGLTVNFILLQSTDSMKFNDAGTFEDYIL